MRFRTKATAAVLAAVAIPLALTAAANAATSPPQHAAAAASSAQTPLPTITPTVTRASGPVPQDVSPPLCEGGNTICVLQVAAADVYLYDLGHNTDAVVATTFQDCTFNNPIDNSYWDDYTWHIECAGNYLNWAKNGEPLSFEGYSSDNNEQWRVIATPCDCEQYWLLNTAGTIAAGQNIFATATGTEDDDTVNAEIEGAGSLAAWNYVPGPAGGSLAR
jgi:hypothetical protein